MTTVWDDRMRAAYLRDMQARCVTDYSCPECGAVAGQLCFGLDRFRASPHPERFFDMNRHGLLVRHYAGKGIKKVFSRRRGKRG